MNYLKKLDFLLEAIPKKKETPELYGKKNVNRRLR
jgi:hypothetical protein